METCTIVGCSAGLTSAAGKLGCLRNRNLFPASSLVALDGEPASFRVWVVNSRKGAWVGLRETGWSRLVIQPISYQVGDIRLEEMGKLGYCPAVHLVPACCHGSCWTLGAQKKWTKLPPFCITSWTSVWKYTQALESANGSLYCWGLLLFLQAHPLVWGSAFLGETSDAPSTIILAGGSGGWDGKTQEQNGVMGSWHCCILDCELLCMCTEKTHLIMYLDIIQINSWRRKRTDTSSNSWNLVIFKQSE